MVTSSEQNQPADNGDVVPPSNPSTASWAFRSRREKVERGVVFRGGVAQMAHLETHAFLKHRGKSVNNDVKEAADRKKCQNEQDENCASQRLTQPLELSAGCT